MFKLSPALGEPIYFASQNRGSLLAFQPKGMEARSVAAPRDVMAVIIELSNGKMQRVELGYGAGFGSQSSREIILPKGARSVVMINFKGEMIPLTIPEMN